MRRVRLISTDFPILPLTFRAPSGYCGVERGSALRRAECASAARKILPRLLKLTGLDRWEWDLVVGPCPEGEVAEIAVLHEYRRFNLSIDPDKAPDEDELLRTLCHEVLHVALSPIEAWDSQLHAALAEEASLRRALRVSLTQAVELAVSQLEPTLLTLYRLTHG